MENVPVAGTVLELGYEFFNVTKGEICTHGSSRHAFIETRQNTPSSTGGG